jgi:hypothetical protein
MSNELKIIPSTEVRVPKYTFRTKDMIDAIIRLRIDKGLTRPNIQKWLIDEVGLSKAKAHRLIQQAGKTFDMMAIQEFGNEIKEDIERFESLYQKSVENGDLKESREILKEISKLKGHYVERVDVSVKEYIVRFPGMDDTNS